MARGGKREGAGRPARASFAEMVSFEERKKFVEFILESYMGDMRLTTWLGDQLFGRPRQDVDLTSAGEAIKGNTVVIEKYDSEAKG